MCLWLCLPVALGGYVMTRPVACPGQLAGARSRPCHAGHSEARFGPLNASSTAYAVVIARPESPDEDMHPPPPPPAREGGGNSYAATHAATREGETATPPSLSRLLVQHTRRDLLHQWSLSVYVPCARHDVALVQALGPAASSPLRTPCRPQLGSLRASTDHRVLFASTPCRSARVGGCRCVVPVLGSDLAGGPGQ